jgi:diaminopimelate decarboxylase
MKPVYEKPVIHRVETGFANKFGMQAAPARRVRREIDGVAVSDLVERFGSPLFVYSEQTLRGTIRRAREAFDSRYPNVTFTWSYKTNYLSAICAIFHEEGFLAEVVSEMEYQKARKMGVPGDRIVYNGPIKTLASLEQAVAEGAMVHVDHMDEIRDLEAVADRLGRRVKVGIRLNMDTGIYPQWSRFGLNVESGQAMDAVRRIAVGGKLVLSGLHAHIGTFILDPGAYGRQVEKMCAFLYQVEDDFGFNIEYLDLGGGFPSKSKLKGTYLPADLAVAPISEFAEAITDALYRSLRPGSLPRVYLESGRAMIDEAGVMITTVHASKRLPDGRRAYIADAGVNLLFTAFWYKFNVEIDREVQGRDEASIVYGPLCMNIDVLDEGINLPPLERGTRLIFSPVGAYNNTQWLQFIAYRPAVVLVAPDGSVDLIREAEDLTDIERRERVPERLRSGMT